MTRQQYRKRIGVIFIAMVTFAIAFYINYVREQIPDTIYIEPYSDGSIEVRLPFVGTISEKDGKTVKEASVNLMSPLIINSAENASYSLDVKLFGVFKIKEIDVYVKECEKVIACGTSIGIHIQTEGVMVVDIGEITTTGGNYEAPCKGIIAIGDYITAVNGIEVTSKSELVNEIQKYTSGYIVFDIRRDGEPIKVKVKPVLDKNGNYKIGAWVRDDCQGLGTLTYITEDDEFGALGHAISDGASGKIVELESGKIYTARIWSIVKGQNGNPGEVIGSINYSTKTCLGEIDTNNSLGIYGKSYENIYDYIERDYMSIAYKQDIEIGKAYVRTYVNGDVEDYEIQITDVSYSDKNTNKGIIFTVTDPELMEITNGIVQGMSGSPIIQNDRVVGAVTHVFVDEPERGYGIFIETMLEH